MNEDDVRGASPHRAGRRPTARRSRRRQPICVVGIISRATSSCRSNSPPHAQPHTRGRRRETPSTLAFENIEPERSRSSPESTPLPGQLSAPNRPGLRSTVVHELSFAVLGEDRRLPWPLVISRFKKLVLMLKPHALEHFSACAFDLGGQPDGAELHPGPAFPSLVISKMISLPTRASRGSSVKSR